MAKMAKAAASDSTGHPAVGKVVILYGTVKAISADGTVRVLGPNSLVFADDQIITESDGSVSLILDGTPPIHLDLGRMSQIVLDEDVYGGAGTSADAAADADRIQALLAGDQPINPEAPAAGGAADSGGGHPIVNYTLTGEEVTPTSGAETRGIEFTALEANDVVVPNDFPTAGEETAATLDDEGLVNGIIGETDNGDDAGVLTSWTGTLPHTFGDDGPGGVSFANMNGQAGHVGTEDVRYSWSGDTLTATVDGGERTGTDLFTVSVDPLTGDYTVTLLDNILHESLDGLTGDDTENNALVDLTYMVTDGNGDSALGTMHLNVDDDTPVTFPYHDGQGTEPVETGGPEFSLAPYSLITAPGEGGNSLINGLGGDRGFGESFLAPNDDGSTGFIDVTSIFPGGMKFFGADYNGFYINNNGNITFAAPMSTYTPFAITGLTSNPMIAPFFADVDTRGAHDANVSPGGTSTGSNLVWYDVDSVNKVITITWDDVGYFSNYTAHVNAFQLRIFNQGDQNFSFEFRYENVDWTTGTASGGNSNGLGGSIAHAGWTAGDGVNFYELPQSGNQSAILGLETTSNPDTTQDGNWVFNVIGGEVIGGDGSGTDIVTVEEESIPGIGGNDETDDGFSYTASGTIVDNVSWGADGFGGVVSVTVDVPDSINNDFIVSEASEGPTTAETDTTITLSTSAWELVVNKETGGYTFTMLDNMSHAPVQGENALTLPTFWITGVDGDGDAAAPVHLIVNVGDDVPLGGTTTAAILDDEGLQNGIIGDPANGDDAGALTTTSGTLTNSYGADGPGGIDSISFADMNNVSGTVGAESVTYHWNASTHTLTADSAARGTIFTVVVTNTTTGTYDLTLNKPVLHESLDGLAGDDTENNALVDLTYTVTDAEGDTATGTLTFNFDDDTPMAKSFSVDAEESPAVDTNLMLILDISGSMDGDPLELTKDAASQLIDSYDGLGDVKVMVVTFSGEAWASTWMAADVAKSYISGLSVDNMTDYDAALAQAKTAFVQDGKIDLGAFQNVSYFLSDGVPTEGDNTLGIVTIPGDDEVDDWRTFLEDNDIKSYALGIGTGISTDSLEPIAFNGSTEPPTTMDPIIVDDISDLASVLTGTASAHVTGNLVDDSDSLFGADGPGALQVVSITHDGVVYDTTSTEYNAGKLTITTHEGGTLVVTFSTGVYDYTVPSISEDAQEVFKFTIQDADGDRSSADLTINITAADDAPMAYDNYAAGDEGTTGETANLVLVIDSSGSIEPDDLNLMKAAVTHLMVDYGDSLGRVMLVDFDDSARVLENGDGNVWMTGTEAIAKLSSIASGGMTDYDDAIAAVQNHYNDDGGAPDADHTYVYFLSDGEPTDWDGGNFGSISGTERTAWESFLNVEQIDEVYAVGVDVEGSALATVAWSSTGNPAANVFEIDSFDDLDATLGGTVPPQMKSGNVITDNDTLGGGADQSGADGWVSPNLLVSVEYNGTTHPFLDASDSVTFNLINSGGKVTIEGDGDYTFTPGTDVSGDKSDVVNYTIADSNGTTDSASLILTTNDIDDLVGDPT